MILLEEKKIPWNKGKGKYRDFLDGNPIECKYHGLHSEWRVLKNNNIKCKFCNKKQLERYYKSNVLKFLFRNAKRHSKMKDLEFNINYEDVFNLYIKQNKRCALSNVEFDDDKIPSLDRISSKIGYVTDNIQLVIGEVNRMKTDLELGEFLDLCDAISKNRFNKNEISS